MRFQFSQDFRFGVATASTQIEGGRVGSNWNHYSDLGKIKDGSNVARANDHFNRVEEDTALLASLGLKDYRMSVEWARIEPENGVFSEAAFAHYRKELEGLHAAGIRPLMTFYHFSHPLWFEEMGAFTKRENVHIFLRFVEACMDAFGDLVADYVTLNEPNVYAVNCYLFGEWAPEKKNILTTLKVMNNFISCHLLAYQSIHAKRKAMGKEDTRVSFAHHMRAFAPRRRHLLDRLGVLIFEELFQDALMRACYRGRFSFPFKNDCKVSEGEYVDFIAINYYTRGAVDLFRDRTFPEVPVNDLGWEIYPAGLIACAQRCYDCLPREIWVTENGCCDNHDRFRIRYLAEHLKRMAESPLPFKAYYHWCFIDNFEWKEGESSRFGIVHCDYESQERRLKDSGAFYRDLAAAKGLNEDLAQRYAKGLAARYRIGGGQ